MASWILSRKKAVTEIVPFDIKKETPAVFRLKCPRIREVVAKKLNCNLEELNRENTQQAMNWIKLKTDKSVRSNSAKHKDSSAAKRSSANYRLIDERLKRDISEAVISELPQNR
jgi:hypothetical protein